MLTLASIPSDSDQLDAMSDIPDKLGNEAVLPCGGNTSQVDREHRHTCTCWCTPLCSYLDLKVLPWELRGSTGHICAFIAFYLTTCYFSAIFKWRSSNVFQIWPAQREHRKNKNPFNARLRTCTNFVKAIKPRIRFSSLMRGREAPVGGSTGRSPCSTCFRSISREMRRLL